MLNRLQKIHKYLVESRDIQPSKVFLEVCIQDINSVMRELDLRGEMSHKRANEVIDFYHHCKFFHTVEDWQQYVKAVQIIHPEWNPGYVGDYYKQHNAREKE